MTDPTSPAESSRRRVLTFRGTVEEFSAFMDGPWLGEVNDVGAPNLREVYEWQLTAAIARHPAGKGLR